MRVRAVCVCTHVYPCVPIFIEPCVCVLCVCVRLILTITTPVCVYTVYYDILLYTVCARAVCVLRAVSFGSSFLIFSHLFSSFLIFWTGTLLHFSDRISFCVCGTLGTHFGIHFELFVFLVSLGGSDHLPWIKWIKLITNPARRGFWAFWACFCSCSR
jgi:hypothetical protein